MQTIAMWIINVPVDVLIYAWSSLYLLYVHYRRHSGETFERVIPSQDNNFGHECRLWEVGEKRAAFVFWTEMTQSGGEKIDVISWEKKSKYVEHDLKLIKK